MKTKIFAAVLLIGFYFISCKKDHDDPFAATRQKLLGKWNNTTTYYVNFSYGSIFSHTDTSHNGEYYNFADDGQLTIHDTSGFHTKPFELKNDSVLVTGSGYDTTTYKIRTLTDTSLRLYSIYVISTHTSNDYTMNFKK